MRISVQYLSQIKGPAGCVNEQIETDTGARLVDVLRGLAERHGNAFRTMILDGNNDPRRSLLYFVGEEHAEVDRPLKDGESITILAPMSGG